MRFDDAIIRVITLAPKKVYKQVIYPLLIGSFRPRRNTWLFLFNIFRDNETHVT